MEFLEKQKKLLEEGKSYECGINIINRTKRYLAQNKHQEASELSLNGSSLLLKHDNSEAAKQLLDMTIKAAEHVTPDFEQVEYVYNLLRSPEDSNFLKQLAKNCKDSRIFGLVARALDDEGNLGQALVYWVAGSNLREIVRTLQILIDRGYPSETDLFISRCVFLLLGFKNLDLAKRVLDQFRYLDTPLMNFSKFLVEALASEQCNLIEYLKEKYQPSLKRDPHLEKYIAKVEKVYLGKETSQSIFRLLG